MNRYICCKNMNSNKIISIIHNNLDFICDFPVVI